jgi:YVTN family beta-propeller protein
MKTNRIVYAALAAVGLITAGSLLAAATAQAPAASASAASAAPVNVYAGISQAHLSPAVRDHLPRVYVPNLRSNDIYVIDPETMKVVDKFKVGVGPQHVVPAWDLQSLWVANNAERTNKGSLTPIDPRTGKPGTQIPVEDPYNMYFTPDGKSAIVVAEALHRLDFRDPHTMQMQYAIDVPECGGINHADFSPDGRYAMFTCEFKGSVARVNLETRKVEGYLKLSMPSTRFSEKDPIDQLLANEVCSKKKGMPQDIRVSPDGKRYYIADMDADGVHVIDAASFTKVSFIPTGVGAHGLYPSRDGTKLYVANRGTHNIHGKRKGKGRVTVIDFATEKVVANWPIPGGGSPDMGNVSADGKWLWLSGRFDDVVYRIDTSNGAVTQVKVGQEPHGLTVWPQPGRYSMGHTGNMR